MDTKPYVTKNVKPHILNVTFKVKTETHLQNTDTNDMAIERDVPNTTRSDGEVIIKQEATELDINETLIKTEGTDFLHTEENLFSCSFCCYKCTKQTNLLEHERIHNGEKPVECNVKTGKTNKTRLRKYTGEKPFDCKFCDYKCYQKGHLYQHMLTHTGQKPFSCALCDYKCYMKPTLRRHFRTHTGEKPFSCSLCDYKCSRKSNLLGHEKTHTREKPFQCTLCSYKCSWKTSLNRHLKTHSKAKSAPDKLLMGSKVQINDEPLTAIKLEEVYIKVETF